MGSAQSVSHVVVSDSESEHFATEEFDEGQFDEPMDQDSIRGPCP